MKIKTKTLKVDVHPALLSETELTPEALGALLAHFENKIMFQGFVWNVNSFDQEGYSLVKFLQNVFLHTIQTEL